MVDRPDFTDPLNRLWLAIAHYLMDKGYAACPGDDESLYSWGPLGLFHVRSLQSLEFDGWEVFVSDKRTSRFETEKQVRDYVVEVVQEAQDEAREFGERL